MTDLSIGSRTSAEVFRYALNGLVATAVNLGILSFLIDVIMLPSAAVSSVIATLFGISTSFIGSRYYVFRNHTGGIIQQATRFVAVYAGLACVYPLLLLVWTDWGGLDYRIGFVLATGLQVVVTYLANKTIVFSE